MTIEYTITKRPWEPKQYLAYVWSRGDSLEEHRQFFRTLFFARRFAKRSVKQIELKLQGPIMIDDARLPSTTITEEMNENSQ